MPQYRREFLKKRTFIKITGIISILGIGCLSIYFAFMGNPIKKHQAVAEIKEYLIHTKMYSEQDFIVNTGLASKSSFCRYGASVTFTDEPKTLYYYSVCKVHQLQNIMNKIV